MTQNFDVFFDLNGWGNNHEASDLRHQCAHYDVFFDLNGPVNNREAGGWDAIALIMTSL